ncbi:MAG: cytochrome c oxidase subunit 3 [Candidatus Acidiferrales bacterium]
MATTTLPPGAEITLDDHGSGRPPELTPRPARVTGAGSPSQKSETGMWVAVSAIGMSFAAFTSAMFVRQDSSTDWQHFQLPHVLYLNTLILIASSVTLEFSRQRFAAISDAAGHAAASAKILLANGVYWLYLTAALGLLFVLGQLLAWRNLVAQGLFLATNPSSSFFYLFTALHAVHLLGGMGGLFYVLRKLVRNGGVAGTSGLSAFSIYWHFMDLLWVYLLLLLAIRM